MHTVLRHRLSSLRGSGARESRIVAANPCYAFQGTGSPPSIGPYSKHGRRAVPVPVLWATLASLLLFFGCSPSTDESEAAAAGENASSPLTAGTVGGLPTDGIIEDANSHTPPAGENQQSAEEAAIDGPSGGYPEVTGGLPVEAAHDGGEDNQGGNAYQSAGVSDSDEGAQEMQGGTQATEGGDDPNSATGGASDDLAGGQSHASSNGGSFINPENHGGAYAGDLTDGDRSGGQDQVTMTNQPDSVATGESRGAEPQRLVAGAVESIQPVDSERFWVKYADGSLVWLSAEGTAALGAMNETIVGAFEASAESFLVAENQVLYMLEGALTPSPLGRDLRDVLWAGSDTPNVLWFVGPNVLTTWYNGVFFETTPPTANGRWNPTHWTMGRWSGRSVIWLAEGSDLWNFRWSGEQVIGEYLALDSNIEAMTATAEGLWLMTDDRLMRLDDDGQWAQWARPPLITSMAGHRNANDLWLSAGNRLWQLNDGVMRERTGLPEIGTMIGLGDGSVLIGTTTGVHQVTAGRYVRVEGLLEGASLNSTVAISISATSPEQVDGLTITTPNAALEVIGEGPWTATLDPADVGPGSHALSVEIRYSDGETITETIHFEGPPSWEQDLEPLAETHCGRCHGVQGAPLPLDSAETWRARFGDILEAVETGRMPIGSRALNVDEVELIRNWSTGGFFDTVGEQ